MWVCDGRWCQVDAMRNMLKSYPNGLMACVSDSFDIYKVVAVLSSPCWVYFPSCVIHVLSVQACSELWGTELKAEASICHFIFFALYLISLSHLLTTANMHTSDGR